MNFKKQINYCYGIYCYKDKKNNKIIYIGKDSHIDKNKRHKAHINKKNFSDQQINRVLQKNSERYEYIVLKNNLSSEEEMNKEEINLIALYNPLFNFTKGGKSNIPDERAKKNMSINHANMSKENNPFFGKKHSIESKKRMSQRKNKTGFFRVSKNKRKEYKKGFVWKYAYYENNKRKFLSSTSLEELERKVKEKNLKWEKIN